MARQQLPSVAVEPAVAARLGVLLGAGTRCVDIAEDRAEAASVDRTRGLAVTLGGRGHPGQVEQGRVQVGHVLVLGSQSSGRDASRPGEDERHAHTAGERLTLVEPKRRVRRHPPPARIVHRRAGRANQVDLAGDVSGPAGGKAARHRGLRELAEVAARPGRPAFGRAAVVRSEHDDGVVELAIRVDGREQAAEILVDVVDHGRVDLLVACETRSLRTGVLRPGLDLQAGLVIARWQAGTGRKEATLELSGKAPRTELVPAIGVVTLVSREVRGPRPERAVHRVVCHVQKEGLSRVVCPQCFQHRDRLIRQIVAQVVLIRVPIDGERAVVLDQLMGMEEAGQTLQATVVTVEAPLDRPRPAVGRCV
jgi:hypothetical protein